MKSNDFKGAHVLVLGAGVTGQSVKKVLTNFGAIVTLVDDALETPLDFSIPQTDWKIAIASPGWPVDHPLVKELNSQGVSVISEIDLAWELHLDLAPSQKWLAITGTNGKTTSVELTTAMLNSGGLNATACGNIGDTVIEAIMHEPPYDHLVLEISSYQLKWSKKPEFVSAAILNIADDHVDWHGSFEDYVASKISILDRSAIAVLNAGDGEVVLATQNWQGRKVFYSLDTPGAGEMGVVEELLHSPSPSA
ncbi:MAG: Mur ligase family protein [Actinobacteria bacterium]|nr:Mur ligase family protein [Actinomycetota bacterium]